jgi:hypothetical protein
MSHVARPPPPVRAEHPALLFSLLAPPLFLLMVKKNCLFFLLFFLADGDFFFFFFLADGDGKFFFFLADGDGKLVTSSLFFLAVICGRAGKNKRSTGARPGVVWRANIFNMLLWLQAAAERANATIIMSTLYATVRQLRVS